MLLALASVDPGSAMAAVLTVTDCGDTVPGGAPGQLRRLINDAASGDTILIPGCLITLNGAPNEDVNASGDLDITKSLTIQGAGAHSTVIDGAFNDRIFDVFPSFALPPPAVITISDLMVRRGLGSQRGGGIRNAGTLNLNRVVVRGNFLSGALEAAGAGISNVGVLNAVEITVEGNSGTGPVLQSGGGIYNQGTFTLIRSTVNGNLVAPSEVFSNSGGILTSGTMTIVDSTISSNNGGQDGPGGINNTGTLTVNNSTIVDNVSLASDNGLRTTGTATLTNTIVADNDNSQCSGAVTSAGGNLASDVSCGLLGANDAVNANAGLGPLSPQGGPTNTHALLPGSPAIDTALLLPCTPTDQRGMPRPQLAGCDKGAFEFTPPLFADVPADDIFRGAMEALLVNGITSGCGAAPLIYCPDDPVTRGQLAVFLLKVLHGSSFVPPPAVGLFLDVPVGSVFAPWIEETFNEGISTGCAPNLWCPNDPVTRAQLSILILRALTVPGFVPPPAVGLFADVPTGLPSAPFIEEFFRRGVTAGCLDDPLSFCPTVPATRAQIAAFLVRAFGFGF
jgi:hypothetical protein